MIWFKKYSEHEVQELCKKRNLMNLLNISIDVINDDSISMTMPVDEKVHQVHGIMHGGATCVLVETVASFASSMCIDLNKQSSVGSVINVNHLRPIKYGVIKAICRPVHIGRQKHVWDVEVKDNETGKIVAKGELTCAVLENNSV